MAWLNVADFNPNALAFWEAAGFTRYVLSGVQPLLSKVLTPTYAMSVI